MDLDQDLSNHKLSKIYFAEDVICIMAVIRKIVHSETIEAITLVLMRDIAIAFQDLAPTMTTRIPTIFLTATSKFGL